MSYSIPRWVNLLMLLALVLFGLHLATEFVVDVSRALTKGIAYTTAFIFPLATLVLFVFLMRTAFPLALKIPLAAALLLYIYGYVMHLYLLHHPDGWGRISGFALFGYNSTLLIVYYVLLARRQAIEAWHAELHQHK